MRHVPPLQGLFLDGHADDEGHHDHPGDQSLRHVSWRMPAVWDASKRELRWGLGSI